MNFKNLKKESYRIPILPETRHEIELAANVAHSHVFEQTKRLGIPVKDIRKVSDFFRKIFFNKLAMVYQNGVYIYRIKVPEQQVLKNNIDKIIGSKDYEIELWIHADPNNFFGKAASFGIADENRFCIEMNPFLIFLESGSDEFVDALTHEMAHAIDAHDLKESMDYVRRKVPKDMSSYMEDYYGSRQEIVAHITQLTERIARRLYLNDVPKEEALNYVANNSLEAIINENKDFFESFFYGSSRSEISDILDFIFGKISPINEKHRKIFYKSLYEAIDAVYKYYQDTDFRDKRYYERLGPDAYEQVFGHPYSGGSGSKKSSSINFKSFKKTSSKEIYIKHVKSYDPELGDIEYWKSGPKKYEVRPKGWRDCMGTIIEFKGGFLLADDPNDELYPSVEDGIHALVKKHNKRQKEQKNIDISSLLRGSGRASF